MIYMRRQFWNEEKTSSSKRTLDLLAEKIGFVLIGGWAVFLYTGAQMSEDIDLAIGYDSLSFFKKYGLNDYGGINIKYTIIDGAVVDLFIEGYADKDLPFPVSDIIKECSVEGNIKVVNKEMLMLLKLWGYFRADEAKSRKDVVDVITLLFYSKPDMKSIKEYVKRYKIEKRRSSDVLLEYLDKGETMWDYITDTKNEYSKLKNKAKEEIKRLFYS